MPGPAIYVVVAVSTVVAAVAFKQFVYDPHLRPKLEAWKENMAEQRRARAQRRRQSAAPVPNSAHQSGPDSSGDDGDALLVYGEQSSSRRRPSLGSEYSSSPIELEQLVSREVDQWRSNVDMSRDQSGLRLRHRRVSDTGTTTSTVNFMDDHIHDPISVQPIEPISSQRTPDIIFEQPQSPLLHPQLPPSPPSTVRSIQALAIPLNERSLSSPFELGSVSASPMSTATTTWQTANAFTTPSVTIRSISDSHRTPSSRASSPDSDLLASSLFTGMSDYHTPPAGSPSLSSPRGAVSPTLSSPRISVDVLSARTSPSPYSSRAASPPVGAHSPGVLLSPPYAHSDFGVLSEDDGVFALPSHASSDLDTDEDASDLASVPGSEASSWADIEPHTAPSRR
ncbi:hypothetical protein HETIRDRAFT_472059 [Heterobasidion irregulare TC 32-1]|uniref:Transmembrane protein n=1 Tax=Heterobasidion irregulare (strain TC 32-1) TaxID=747525 RepID=W4KEL6_HETIT|nr:uncharacterized protein HETIRDRAFT_472059 [Heterobasidion irregulare TC 32-1]ETW83760.1 hypothetical protein HETIRDRAFT_472059 [Heterobasidion irregulare TC 32-1]